MGRPPEFISLAARGAEPGWQGVIVHPDPPLANVEKELLKASWGRLTFLSMSQWLAERA